MICKTLTVGEGTWETPDAVIDPRPRELAAAEEHLHLPTGASGQRCSDRSRVRTERPPTGDLAQKKGNIFVQYKNLNFF